MLPVWREKWRRYVTATEPADRDAAEKATLALYKTLRRDRPHIVWLDSPYGLREGRHDSRHELITNDGLFRTFLDLELEVFNDTAIGFFALRHTAGGPQLGAIPLLSRRYYARRLATIDFAINVMKRRNTPLPLRAYTSAIKLAKEVSAAFLGPTTATLCERWCVCSLDDDMLPHSMSGPAIQFRDGIEKFAYHGREMSHWADFYHIRDRLTIDDPFVASRSRLDSDFLVNLYGLERLFDDVVGKSKWARAPAVQCLDNDPQYGSLYRVSFGMFAIQAIRVVNASPEPDGTHRVFWIRVPNRFAKARTAVAWTFGIRSGARYRPVAES